MVVHGDDGEKGHLKTGGSQAYLLVLLPLGTASAEAPKMPNRCSSRNEDERA